MDALWAFLNDPENQKTLGWLGGGFAMVAAGLWAVIKFFAKPETPAKPQPTTSVSADRGGIAAGRDAHVGAPPKAPRKPTRRRG